MCAESVVRMNSSLSETFGSRKTAVSRLRRFHCGGSTTADGRCPDAGLGRAISHLGLFPSTTGAALATPVERRRGVAEDDDAPLPATTARCGEAGSSAEGAVETAPSARGAGGSSIGAAGTAGAAEGTGVGTTLVAESVGDEATEAPGRIADRTGDGAGLQATVGAADLTGDTARSTAPPRGEACSSGRRDTGLSVRRAAPMASPAGAVSACQATEAAPTGVGGGRAPTRRPMAKDLARSEAGGGDICRSQGLAPGSRPGTLPALLPKTEAPAGLPALGAGSSRRARPEGESAVRAAKPPPGGGETKPPCCRCGEAPERQAASPQAAGRCRQPGRAVAAGDDSTTGAAMGETLRSAAAGP